MGRNALSISNESKRDGIMENKSRTYLDAVSEGYSLDENHCSIVVQKALRSAGIDIYHYSISQGRFGVSFNKVAPHLPSVAYKTIKANNPQGVTVHKRK